MLFDVTLNSVEACFWHTMKSYRRLSYGMIVKPNRETSEFQHYQKLTAFCISETKLSVFKKLICVQGYAIIGAHYTVC